MCCKITFHGRMSEECFSWCIEERNPFLFGGNSELFLCYIWRLNSVISCQFCVQIRTGRKATGNIIRMFNIILKLKSTFKLKEGELSIILYNIISLRHLNSKIITVPPIIISEHWLTIVFVHQDRTSRCFRLLHHQVYTP